VARQGGGWTVAFAGISPCGHVTNWATMPDRKQEIDKLCTAHQHEYKVGDLKREADEADKEDDVKKSKEKSEAYRAGLRTWQTRIDALAFAERLWMTVRWSDNLAATQTAASISESPADASGATKAITLAYIQALIRESGLGNGVPDDRKRLGLWLNGAWQLPPTRPRKLDLWGQQPWHKGDAQSFARLLLALANGELVSRAANSEMMSLLQHLDPVVDIVGTVDYFDLDDGVDRGLNWAASYIGNGAAFALGIPNIFSCASKIGIVGNIIADWALIECRLGSARPDRYRLGVVVVNGSRANDTNNIQTFAQSLFGKLKANDLALASP